MTYKYLRSVLILIGVLALQFKGFAQVKVQNIGTVDGVNVAKEEVRREMRRYRFEVYNFVASKKGEINGAESIEILRKKAIDSLAVIKVQEKLLTERNLWPYKDYQEFLTDLHNSNNNRRKLSANGQVIYGPVEYNEQTFFDYRFSNALIQLKQKLVAEKLITITDDNLQTKFKKLQETVYKEEKYTLSAFARQVKDAYIEEAYAALIKHYAQNAKRNLDLNKVNRINLTN